MRPLRFPALLVASVVVHVAMVAAFWRAAPARAAQPAPLDALPSSTLVGETFEVPAERADDSPEPIAADPVPPSLVAPEAALASASASASALVPPRVRASAPAIAATPPTPSAPGAVAPQLYGAVGVRYAVDLLDTFGRQIPQASYRDPRWTTMTLGPAGAAEVSLEIDDAGHLREEVHVLGAPSDALRAAVLGTVALIGGHAFTSRAARSHLRITATITADSVGDDWHGKSFASSGVPRFVDDVAHAFFAYGGRRVDFTLQRLH